jgi:hypothetical protein
MIARALALTLFATFFTACTSRAPDGPHELVREEVLGALVSREACKSAMTKMLDRPTQPGVAVVFRCRLNTAAKPGPFVETPGTPSTPAAEEPVAAQPAVAPAATAETPQESDAAAERVYQELLRIERERRGQ